MPLKWTIVGFVRLSHYPKVAQLVPRPSGVRDQKPGSSLTPNRAGPSALVYRDLEPLTCCWGSAPPGFEERLAPPRGSSTPHYWLLGLEAGPER